MSKKDLIKRVEVAFVAARNFHKKDSAQQYHTETEKILISLIKGTPSPTIEHHEKRVRS